MMIFLPCFLISRQNRSDYKSVKGKNHMNGEYIKNLSTIFNE